MNAYGEPARIWGRQMVYANPRGAGVSSHLPWTGGRGRKNEYMGSSQGRRRRGVGGLNPVLFIRLGVDPPEISRFLLVTLVLTRILSCIDVGTGEGASGP